MKTCKNCSKDFDYPGFYCHWCSEKRRAEKRKGVPCKGCNKVKGITNKTFHLCTACYCRKLENADPIYKEKKRISKFKSRRKCRGQDPDAPLMKKRNGEGYIDKNGYKQITIANHPNMTSKRGRIAEHTAIMAFYLGRPLRERESVHHKNGIRNDNRIENLELWHRGQPSGQRLEDKLEWAKKFLEDYGFSVIKKDF